MGGTGNVVKARKIKCKEENIKIMKSAEVNEIIFETTRSKV